MCPTPPPQPVTTQETPTTRTSARQGLLQTLRRASTPSVTRTEEEPRTGPDSVTLEDDPTRTVEDGPGEQRRGEVSGRSRIFGLTEDTRGSCAAKGSRGSETTRGAGEAWGPEEPDCVRRPSQPGDLSKDGTTAQRGREGGREGGSERPRPEKVGGPERVGGCVRRGIAVRHRALHLVNEEHKEQGPGRGVSCRSRQV